MATIEHNPTREVFNQPPPLEGYNLYRENRALHAALDHRTQLAPLPGKEPE